MKKTVRRKLFLFGRYSLALLPPKKWLSKLGIKEGDFVDIKLDSSKRRLIVSFDIDETVTDSRNGSTPKKKNSHKDGWEPIPHL